MFSLKISYLELSRSDIESLGKNLNPNLPQEIYPNFNPWQKTCIIW